MRTKSIFWMLAAILVTNVAFAQGCCEHKEDHKGHKMEHGDHKMDMSGKHGQVMGMDLMGPQEHYEVSADFQKQLNDIYEATLNLNQAFVDDSSEKVKQDAAKILSQLNTIDMGLLKGEAHMTWMKQSHVMSTSLNSLVTADNIKDQRSGFATFNEALYAAVKTYGIGQTVYFLHCPMFKANWLSSSEDVANPYYGQKMLKCGSNTEIIN